ncbi:hypothetical protein [Paludibaculum fermentans]|uniref:Glycosyltransferase RgtA/B/C/D-like domain-containing protein n=1 Tax=Paludibaculum fermentans TaxID=1473598 RepID=A0A7S7NMJ4_PALFE|nr:hypothetical protein [Paludibaculum fermentans]QOY86388.1 hypothetical protein IRI77_26775 [Paludibaculum fermentans]
MPQRARPTTYVYFFLIFLIAQFGIHATLVTMPYFWDEVGSTVPAAQAMGHPGAFPTPAVSLYLAGVWKLFGASEVSTRCGMLLLSAVAMLGIFLLSIELCGSLQGAPAIMVAALTALSPLYFSQSVLAQTPIPAALCMAYGLWFYLTGRRVVAGLFGLALLWVLFSSLPAIGWGHVIPPRPADFVVMTARRFSSLFLANFHFLGTIGLLMGLRSGRLNRTRWKFAGGVAGVYFLSLCVAAPVLDRDLVPVLPVFYTAAVVGFYSYASKWRMALPVAMLCGFLACLWFAPPFWSDSIENSLAMSDFSDMQRMTAAYLEQNAKGQVVATAWPLSVVLKDPQFGFVEKPVRVMRLPDFSATCLAKVEKDSAGILVRYSRSWDPPRNILPINRATRWFGRRYLGYQLPIEPDEIERKLGLHLAASWQKRGQWVEIYSR